MGFNVASPALKAPLFLIYLPWLDMIGHHPLIPFRYFFLWTPVMLRGLHKLVCAAKISHFSI